MTSLGFHCLTSHEWQALQMERPRHHKQLLFFCFGFFVKQRTDFLQVAVTEHKTQRLFIKCLVHHVFVTKRYITQRGVETRKPAKCDILDDRPEIERQKGGGVWDGYLAGLSYTSPG